jgi:6-pyruvoyltetrahydropterin/6-carboxytetrahydropterin synthase
MGLEVGEKFSVTKIVKFDAAHRLPGYPGHCANLHGHTWKVEVEVRLADEEVTNYNPKKDKMLIDFSNMKEIMKDRFLEKLDHSYINTEEGELDYPSAENITLWIKDRLWHAFPSYVYLCRVRVWESEDSYAEWRAL